MDCVFKRLHTSDRTSGFTLAEFLVVLAVMAILTCVGIPTSLHLYVNWKVEKLDEYAKEIYLAAQNRLTSMQATGGLSVLDDAESFTSSQPYIDDDRFVTVSYLKSSDPLMAYLLPEGALTMSGEYVIEYDQDTAVVLSVYYHEEGTFTYNVVSNRVTTFYDEKAYIRNMSREARVEEGIYVGYYGGKDVVRPEEEQPKQAIARIVDDINNNILYAIVYTPENVGNASVKITTVDRKQSYTVNFALSPYTIVNNTDTLANDCTIGGVWNQKLECRMDNARTVNAYVILLDSLEEGKRFKNISAFEAAAGKDLTIESVTLDGEECELDTTLVNVHNSLFDTADPAQNTYHIKSARHLQNIAADRALTSTYMNGNGYVKNTVEGYYPLRKAVLDNDIVWPEGEVFYPITNDQLMSFEGNNHSISKVNITGNVVSEYVLPGGGTYKVKISMFTYQEYDYKYVPVGLFGWFGGNELKNLSLVDCSINYQTKPNLNITYAGMLAGVVSPINSKTTIDNCHVYGESAVKEVKADFIRIENGVMAAVNSKSHVGGLVGEIIYNNRNTDVKNSSVSLTELKVGSTTGGKISSCGGLVGWFDHSRIERCYTECGILKDGTWIGGINAQATSVGSFLGYMTDGTVDSCYATGYIKTDYGFAGKVETLSGWLIKDSYLATVCDNDAVSYKFVSSFIGTDDFFNTLLTLLRRTLSDKLKNNYMLKDQSSSDLTGLSYITYDMLSSLELSSQYEKATEAKTHRYGQELKTYPFPKLKDGTLPQGSMDHYGDWPNGRHANVEAAYYEIYRKKNTDLFFVGFQSPGLIDTLLYGNDLASYDIVQDGYSILLKDTGNNFANNSNWNNSSYSSWLTGSNKKISVEFEKDDGTYQSVTPFAGKEFKYNGTFKKVTTLKYDENISQDKNPVEMYLDGDNYTPIFISADGIVDGNFLTDEYYQHLRIVDTKNSSIQYDFWFNPHFAKSPVSKVEIDSQEVAGESIIRTERQFARLMKTGANDIAQKVYTSEKMNIIVENDLNYTDNANVYTTSFFDVNLKDAYAYGRTLTGMIANEDGDTFKGSFNGQNHTIRGIKRSATSPSIFKTISGGTVKNTIFQDISYTNKPEDGAVLAQSVNDADISGITIRNLKIEATKTASGLIKNASGSKISDITLDSIDLKCENGTVAGMAQKCVSTGVNNVTSQNGMTIRAGGNDSAGIIGRAESSVIENIRINGNLDLENKSGTTGGVIGSMLETTAKKIDIATVNTSKTKLRSVAGVLGGVIGIVENGSEISNVRAGSVPGMGYEFKIEGNEKTTNAGGMIGEIVNTDHEVIFRDSSIRNAEVHAHFKIDERNADDYYGGAGMVGAVNAKSALTLDNLSMNTMNIKVHADHEDHSEAVCGGGFIGRLAGKGKQLIDLKAEGTNTIEFKAEKGYVGGYIGALDNDKAKVSIELSKDNNAKITFASDDKTEYAGGIIGVIQNGKEISVDGDPCDIYLGDVTKKMKAKFIGGLFAECLADETVKITSEDMRIPLYVNADTHDFNVENGFGGMTAIYHGNTDISENIVPVINNAMLSGNNKTLFGGFAAKNESVLYKPYVVEVNTVNCSNVAACGGFVGKADADIRNSSVYSQNNLWAITSNGYVGGFVGQMNAFVSNCSTDINVNGGGAKAQGGFVGIVESGAVSESVSSGMVSAGATGTSSISASGQKHGNNNGGFAGDYRVIQPKNADAKDQLMNDCAMLLEDLFNTVHISMAKIDNISDPEMTNKDDISYFKSYYQRFEDYRKALVAYRNDPSDTTKKSAYLATCTALGYLDPVRIIGTTYDDDERPVVKDFVNTAYDSTIIGTADKILRRNSNARQTKDNGLITFDILNVLNGVNAEVPAAMNRYQKLIDKYGIETFHALQFDVVWHTEDGKTFCLLEGDNYIVGNEHPAVYRNVSHMFGVNTNTLTLNHQSVIAKNEYGETYSVLDPVAAGINTRTYTENKVANTPFDRCAFEYSIVPAKNNNGAQQHSQHWPTYADYSDMTVNIQSDLSANITQYGVDGIYRVNNAQQYIDNNYPNLDDSVTKYTGISNRKTFDVTLTWDDDTDRDGLRPSAYSMKVRMRTADGTYDVEKTLTNSHTSDTFPNAVIYRGNRMINYIVTTDADISGYETHLEKSAEGYTVCMVHVPEKVSLTFRSELTSDETVLVYIDENGNGKAETSEIVKTAVLRSHDETTIDDLFKNNDGEEITYSYAIGNDAPAGYHYVYTVNAKTITIGLEADPILSTTDETTFTTDASDEKDASVVEEEQ